MIIQTDFYLKNKHYRIFHTKNGCYLFLITDVTPIFRDFQYEGEALGKLL